MSNLLKLTLCCLATLCPSLSYAESATPEQIAFFETKIRPLLLKHCVDCHGPDEQESELRLDTPAGIMQGGASGELLSPGRPDASLLFTAVLRQGELKMPPEGALSKAEIGNLKHWIEQGAGMPDAGVQVRRSAIDWDAARRHWAFLPLKQGPPPQIAGDVANGESAHWPSNSVDLYILKRLQARDLSPSPAADPATLVRRVTLDLTGLPPTPEQVQWYTASPTPRRYAQLVDQLLSSPAYGERWGRHWLDVARYADSNGLDENIAHGNAWRYRDYVVEAFNEDLPYDAFIHQQLAGDLLEHGSPQHRRRHLIATGYMSLGPKVLAEVDEAKMEMDIIDEQIDTVGKSLLGLTLGCARCHDHKFDPITAKDYYALAGIFKSTKTMEHFTKIARWNEAPLPRTPAEEQQAQKFTDEVATVKTDIARWEKLAKTKTEQGESKEDPQAKLKELKARLKKIEGQLAELASAMSLAEREVTNVRVHIRGSHLTQGDEVPRRFLEVLAPEKTPLSKESSGRLEFARWLTGPQQHLLARVIANRVWRWHWGRGLTPSVDNFGVLGEQPSHPALLDHLAGELIRHDWSIKSVHRLIVCSSAYQQQSRHRDDAMAVDAGNRWLWRFEPRRLEAEALRDSMLAVSGQLDRRMGGSMLHVANRAFFFDHTSKDETKYDQPKRSIYLPVVRNNLFDGFMLFDYSDASTLQGNRNNSVTAPQSLYLLNAELVDEAARRLAQRTSHLIGEARARQLMLMAFGRDASDAEVQGAVTFVQQYAKETDDSRAWRAMAHALLASNEFIYLR